MRSPSIGLSILILILGVTALTTAFRAHAEPLTVMSYNIRYDNPADGINAWPYRTDAVAEMSGPKYGTDIAGLQEALRHQIDQLQDRLPDYKWVGVGRDDGLDRGEFSPIFFRSERLQLLATNTFWLSETPDIPRSRSWDAAITRIVTWARFLDRHDEREIYVFNTHFDHRGEQARIESSRMLAQAITRIAGDNPVVLLGDLNVPESSEAYAVLASAPMLHDARYRSETGHSGPTASFNDWETLRPDESRIDYVFTTDHFSVLSHKILDDRYDGRFPSDHLPVLAEIILSP